jgi:hypothetical protein
VVTLTCEVETFTGPINVAADGGFASSGTVEYGLNFRTAGRRLRAGHRSRHATRRASVVGDDRRGNLCRLTPPRSFQLLHRSWCEQEV